MTWSNRAHEHIAAAIAVLLGLALHFIVIPWEVNIASSQTDEMSPAFFPRIVAYALIAVGVVSILFNMRIPRSAEPDMAPGVTPDRAPTGWMGPVGISITLLTWPLLAPRIGFAATLGVTIASIQYFLLPWSLSDWRRNARAAAVAIVGALVVIGLFGSLLGVPLPNGTIW